MKKKVSDIIHSWRMPVICGVALLIIVLIVCFAEDIASTVMFILMIFDAISVIFLCRWIKRKDKKRTASLIIGIITGILAIMCVAAVGIENNGWITISKNDYSFKVKRAWEESAVADTINVYGNLHVYEYPCDDRETADDIFCDSTINIPDGSSITSTYSGVKTFKCNGYEAATAYGTSTNTSTGKTSSAYCMGIIENGNEISFDYEDDGKLENRQDAQHVFNSIRITAAAGSLKTISGNPSDVVTQCQSLKTNERAKIEVTGYVWSCPKNEDDHEAGGDYSVTLTNDGKSLREGDVGCSFSSYDEVKNLYKNKRVTIKGMISMITADSVYIDYCTIE